jgi:hypothetical protein
MLEPVEEAAAVLQRPRRSGGRLSARTTETSQPGQMRAEGDGDRQLLGLGVGAGAQEREAVETGERRAERVPQAHEAGGEHHL